MFKPNYYESIKRKEFKALIKKYESLTEDQILDESKESDSMADMLCRTTGFGTKRTCTLCKVVRIESVVPGESFVNCDECIYGIMSPGNEITACIKGANEDTYNAIEETDNFYDLLIAIQNRANHMKEVWKQYLKQSK